MDKITEILENVVRYAHFEVGVRIKNPINVRGDSPNNTACSCGPYINL